MTTTDPSDENTKAARGDVRLAILAVIFVLPTTTIINFLIFRTRILFSQFHPEEVANKPPTISGAIADPRIGEPFAAWITILAPFVGLAVLMIVWLAFQDWRRASQGQRGRMSRAWAIYGGSLIVILQAAACIGMIMLARNRFPDGRDLHMLGSYIFFTGQGFTVLVGGLWVARLATMADRPTQVYSSYLLERQGKIAWIPVVLAIFYVVLFVGKDLVSEGIWPYVMQIYVWTELAVISSFLIYLAIFSLDLIKFILNRNSRA